MKCSKCGKDFSSYLIQAIFCHECRLWPYDIEKIKRKMRTNADKIDSHIRRLSADKNSRKKCDATTSIDCLTCSLPECIG
jgi:hypothetical protein